MYPGLTVSTQDCFAMPSRPLKGRIHPLQDFAGVVYSFENVALLGEE
jgi:predicted trehalose synthase